MKWPILSYVPTFCRCLGTVVVRFFSPIRSKKMPESQQPPEGQRLMVEGILSGPCHNILDVGAGDGRWGKLLKGKVKRIVALEIWPPYIRKYSLHSLYDGVFVMDAKKFDGWADFDVVILGDVLEHMERDDAITLINKLKNAGVRTYLTVPVSTCIQDGTVYRNPYETHLDQWSDEELRALGWRHLHTGPNPKGLVQIGTYCLNEDIKQ